MDESCFKILLFYRKVMSSSGRLQRRKMKKKQTHYFECGQFRSVIKDVVSVRCACISHRAVVGEDIQHLHKIEMSSSSSGESNCFAPCESGLQSFQDDSL